MSADFAIKVENLSKVYKLYESPQDRLKEALHPFRKRYHRPFYALNDVNFEIKRGETVGIIGSNGAGKSTLLKIITGVLTPSHGRVEVKGKISALLELGAGFNPQLNGIENIYFNGALMGFSREEMEAKLDSILSFADIGDFVYQPVKTYSSGMASRLAFSVAISVDPEILIVDEALAVGDIAFQYKCYQRMWSMKEKGATLLLVTHSTRNILEQCDKAILLNHGNLICEDSDVEEVVAQYEKLLRKVHPIKNAANGTSTIELSSEDFQANPIQEIGEKRFGSARAIIKDVVVTKDLESDEDAVALKSGKKMFIKFLIYSKEDIREVALGVSLRRKDSADIWGDNNIYARQPLALKKGINRVVYETTVNVVSGDYLLFCGLATLSGEAREELDQRWPIRVITVTSDRETVGFVYSPIKVIVGD